MTANRNFLSRRVPATIRRSGQRGLSVLFAMLALVALSFAAAGLVRSSGGAAMVIGNLAFKAETNSFADQGTEAAIAWLQARSNATLADDDTANGYYSTNFEGIDATGQMKHLPQRVGVDWDGDGCASAAGVLQNCITPSAKVTVGDTKYSFVVTRLCTLEGAVDDVGNSCITGLEEISLGGAGRDGYDYAHYMTPPSVSIQNPSFRIVVRAEGTRNAVTYTETIVRR